MYNTFHELSEKRHNWFYFCWKQRRQTALCMHWYPNYVPRTNSEPHTAVCLLGESGGVVNSLDFHPASLKSLGQFYFKCLLSAVYWASQAGLLTPMTFTQHVTWFYFKCLFSSQRKAVTVTPQSLQCQLLRHFRRPILRMCLATSNNLLLLLLGDSGRVVNSIDFCLASLKSLGCFYFRCVLYSQWKAVTVNLRILHCQR